MNKRYDVISVGSATLDVFLRCDDFRVTEGKGSFTGQYLQVPYGGKSEVSQLAIQSGGGGTNTAVGFARLGLSSAVLARCGRDFACTIVRQDLKKERVSPRLILALPGDQTDYSTILVGPDGGRTILVSRGSTRLEAGQVFFNTLRASWLYISSIEGNLDLLACLLDHADRNGIKVAVNPGRKELAQPAELGKLLGRADVVILNREEAARLTGYALKDARVLPAVAALVKELAVITNGSEGAVVYDREDRQLVSRGFSVKMVDATGAGDAFGCGFVAGLVKGIGLEEALRLGIANGAAVVTQLGAKTGLIREREVESWFTRKLDLGWVKTEK